MSGGFEGSWRVWKVAIVRHGRVDARFGCRRRPHVLASGLVSGEVRMMSVEEQGQLYVLIGTAAALAGAAVALSAAVWSYVKTRRNG
jgi:hypothetical protein